MDSDSDDEVVTSCDVVFCGNPTNTDVYRMQFPARKKNVFDNHPRIRYKKNVKMIELRLPVDTSSGSYDKSKRADSGMDVKPDINRLKFGMEEVYEGRAFTNANSIQVVGVMRNGQLALTPISGSFNMHKVIEPPNITKKNAKDDEAELTEESDAEGGSGGQQLRVKFSRPETDRQKKRREASALHREKMIASDQWISMNVHLDSTQVESKRQNIASAAPTDSEETPTMRELVQKAIICDRIEQIDLTRVDQLLSLQRIRDLPTHQQVKAQIIKSRVICTSDVARLVDERITRQSLIQSLQECAHLVNGVWVLNSQYLFHGLPPASSNVPGRIDERRSQVWRDARDLGLCLIGAGHRVTRTTLAKCFHLNVADAEEILSTFGVKADRTWKLRVGPDEEFLNDRSNLQLLVKEREFWNAKWNELQQIIAAK